MPWGRDMDNPTMVAYWSLWMLVWICALLVGSQGGWVGMLAVVASYNIGRRRHRIIKERQAWTSTTS